MSRLLAWSPIFLLLAAPPAGAQVGFEATYGRWWHDDPATTFQAGLFGPLLGPFSWSVGVTHLDDHLAVDDRTQTGAALGLGLFRDGSGLYSVADAGIAMRHGRPDLDATWSAGLGWALRFVGGTALAVEARYRWEDRRFAGFWQLDPTDRQGWSLQGRVSFPLGGGRATRPGTPTAPRTPDPPSRNAVERIARSSGASGDAAELTSSVVQTALEVMGAPYQWGGSDDNGFDCSGLIQFAYGAHGIILPRVSRDQIQQGTAISLEVGALRPGDLLGFSVEGRGVSHIALYVGEGQFIHSASQGVTVTSLTATDPNSLWWRRRWVSARRIVE